VDAERGDGALSLTMPGDRERCLAAGRCPVAFPRRGFGSHGARAPAVGYETGTDEGGEMGDQAELARRFLALHEGVDGPLLLANAWDAGSAKLLEAAGFDALATTSSGYAATRGRLDYGVNRDDVLAHVATVAAATALPVSADFEDCFGKDGAGVAETVRLGRDAGLAGCSIEDWSDAKGALYDIDTAAERVAAAAQEAHSGSVRLVLTARAENFLRGNTDVADTIARLKAYEDAGADVLYAPAFDRPQDLRELLSAVSRPVNVLARGGAPSVAELAQLGVKRVSVGGAFAFAAYGAALQAAQELRERGTYGYSELSAAGARAARAAFSG
jgi:2-methylisocitrate lyase-like PEP mutase family enzyme